MTDDSEGPKPLMQFDPKMKIVGTSGQVEPIDEAVSNRRYWVMEKMEDAVIDLDEQEVKAKAATVGPWRETGKRETLPGEAHGMRTADGSLILAEHHCDAAHIAACSPDRVLAMVAALKVARRVTDLSIQLVDAINRHDGLRVAEIGVERANALTDLKSVMKVFK